MTPEQAAAALEAIRERRAKARRRQLWRKSKLDRFRADIVSMHRQQASLGEIVTWLASKRIKVERSTVLRFMRSLPEVSDGQST